MPKSVRKRVKKVLKPAQATEVKLLAKSLFIRSTHGQVHQCSHGASTSISIDEMISKMNHYSIKVQEKNLLKIDTFLESNGSSMNSEQKLKVLQATAYKLLSEHDDVRKHAHRILLNFFNTKLMHLSHIEATIFPALRAAMTHTDPAVRIGTLPFLGPFLSMCEIGRFNPREFGSPSRSCFEVDALHLLLTLQDILSEELFSKTRLPLLNSTLFSMGKLMDFLSHGQAIERYIKNESRIMMEFVGGLIRFLGSSSTLEVILNIIHQPREFHPHSKNASQDKKTFSGIEHEIFSAFLKCLAHSLSVLFLIRNSGQKTKKANSDIVSLAKNTLNSLEPLFDGCRTSYHKTNIAILVKLIGDEIKEQSMEEYVNFSDKVTIWLIEAYCSENHSQTSRKLTLLIWEKAHLEDETNDYRSLFVKLFPDATVSSEKKITIRDFIRQSIRKAAIRNQFEFFSNGIIGLLRERVEVFLNGWNIQRTSDAETFHDWEFELFADLPFVLWRLLKKYSTSHLSLCENENQILENISAILWHVIRTFGGMYASERHCHRQINKITQGILLLNRQSKLPCGEIRVLQKLLQQTIFYCDSPDVKMCVPT